jgi:alpha-L-rhamnosidase
MTLARDDIESAFRTPPASARALLRWWWPGGAVDADALCEQLREFARSGWGGVEIQAFRVGLPHVLPAVAAESVHEVFTPRWFETVRVVMDEAERLGLTVDITFGSCWPFGGGEAITPELAAQELSLAWTTVNGPGAWQGRPNAPARPQRFGARMERDGAVDAAQALPDDWRARIEAMAHTVAVLAVRGGTPSLGPFAGFVPLTLPDIWGQVHAAGWIDAAATIDPTKRL